MFVSGLQCATLQLQLCMSCLQLAREANDQTNRKTNMIDCFRTAFNVWKVGFLSASSTSVVAGCSAMQTQTVLLVWCVQTLNRPMRNDPKWNKVVQVLLDNVGDDMRKPYLRLAPAPSKKQARAADEDGDEGGAEDSGKRAKGDSKDAVDLKEGTDYKQARGGDFAFATSLFCRPGPDANTVEMCMEVMLEWFDKLAQGDACAVASHKSLSREVRAKHGKDYIANFRCIKLQPFITLNSADWLEMFRRMLPTPGVPAFSPGSKQYSLDETLLVRVVCGCRCACVKNT